MVSLSPAYMRVASDIRHAIETGSLRAHDKVNSVDVLARQYGLSLGTVRRAFEMLQVQGIIYRKQGAGTFVSEQALTLITKGAKPSRTNWTADRIRACGVRMSGVDAVEAVYGYSPWKAYKMLAAGEVDFPVIRRGRRYIVPTSAVLKLLQIEDDPTE